jgi:hypothetical protein
MCLFSRHWTSRTLGIITATKNSGWKQTPFRVLNIYSQALYTKPQNCSFIIHQVNTAKWSSRRLWCGVSYQSVLLNLVNRVLESSALNSVLHLYVFHCYSWTDNVISSYTNIIKYFFGIFLQNEQGRLTQNRGVEKLWKKGTNVCV